MDRDWVTFEDSGKINIHRWGCCRLGQHDGARYAQAVSKGGEGPYQFHASEGVAERYARERGYDSTRINRSCSSCR